VTLFKFKKYFYGAPRSMKMGTIVSPWHYDAASPRAPIDKSAMASDLAQIPKCHATNFPLKVETSGNPRSM